MKKFLLAVMVLALSIPCFAQKSGASAIGHEIIERGNYDTWTYFSMIDLSLQFQDAGQVNSWSIYSQSPGSVYLQVFRNISGNVFEVVGENFLEVSNAGVNHFNIAADERINYQSGDYIGWTFTNPAVISFNYGGGNLVDYSPVYVTGVGNTLNFYWGPDERTYSIAANQPVPEPATMLLLGSGLIGLAGLKKKRS